ncbi:S41 family peptidase [Rhodospirillum centenum]|uniref:Carboxyl-terminal protease n=1 Tax=Rhodospirillum centenum (strain ATCC 51521 / SW) TaxID=414684 RepID=B6IN37_RHOCS|nr:S41 family peptidase [Rhodospirillum centenum]ACI98934.1 carboxyl-terminal protease [Rhodospirillum centenum SW]
MLRRLAPVVLAFSLVGGCAAGHSRDYAPVRERVVGEHVFAMGYARISEIYLDPVDLRRLTLDGLSGLTKLDPAVSLAVTGTTLEVRTDGRMVGAFDLPVRGDDPAAWATLTARAAERLRASSPVLAATDTDAVYQAIFDGIIADLDSYSRYTGGQRAVDERSQREGYGGIGVAVRHDETRHEITEVLIGGPAESAGLRAGDLILAIDGTPTARLTTEEVGERLRGPAGSLVTLTVGRSPKEGRRLSVRRDRVIPSTVVAHAEDGVGYLQVDRFNAATAPNLRAAVRRLRAELGQRARGFVLDLRGNPGGLLDQAVAVADIFIPGGRIISTRGRHPDSMQVFDARPDDEAGGLPLVVLIDGRSASAAEIVAAALQDSGRAALVGSSSFGKGSVQTVTRLPNDGELFLTWSRIYAPSGYTLHRQGVQPTVCTSLPALDVNAALRTVRLGGMLPAATLLSWRIRAPEDEIALAQLRETCPWKEHAPDLDLQVAKALLGDPPLYREALLRAPTAVAERQDAATAGVGLATSATREGQGSERRP